MMMWVTFFVVLWGLARRLEIYLEERALRLERARRKIRWDELERLERRGDR